MKARPLGSPKSIATIRPTYAEGSVESPGMPEGGRSLAQYESALLFNREELEGFSVLDLGAGSRVRFAKELAESGVNARVISLSPDFGTRLYSKPAREGHPEGKLLAALGQRLPFPNNSFDRVFALHVYAHLASEVFEEMLPEMARVLKYHGRAVIGRFVNPPIEPSIHERLLRNDKLLQVLVEHGIESLSCDTFVRPERKVEVRDNWGDERFVRPYNIVLYKGGKVEDWDY